jgi:hypothetical protein
MGDHDDGVPEGNNIHHPMVEIFDLVLSMLSEFKGPFADD